MTVKQPAKRLLIQSALILATVISGCASHIDHSSLIEEKAEQLHAHPEVIATSQHPLQTFQVMPRASQTLRVYVEGDGRAWVRRSRPSIDPTPHKLVVMDLMSVDPATDKVYIARPCQFIMTDRCSISTWTDQRFNKAAVDSLDEVINTLKSRGDYKRIELVGFSGGAALALLVAAQRRDVVSVRTVAGNLDPAYVNRIHNVSFMPDAMSPVKFTRELDDVPQLHFSGSDDDVIPPKVYAAYRTWFGKQDCISGITIDGATHHEGWQQQWKTLLQHPLPQCVSTPPPLRP